MTGPDGTVFKLSAKSTVPAQKVHEELVRRIRAYHAPSPTAGQALRLGPTLADSESARQQAQKDSLNYGIDLQPGPTVINPQPEIGTLVPSPQEEEDQQIASAAPEGFKHPFRAAHTIEQQLSDSPVLNAYGNAADVLGLTPDQLPMTVATAGIGEAAAPILRSALKGVKWATKPVVDGIANALEKRNGVITADFNKALAKLGLEPNEIAAARDAAKKAQAHVANLAEHPEFPGEQALSPAAKARMVEIEPPEEGAIRATRPQPPIKPEEYKRVLAGLDDDTLRSITDKELDQKVYAQRRADNIKAGKPTTTATKVKMAAKKPQPQAAPVADETRSFTELQQAMRDTMAGKKPEGVQTGPATWKNAETDQPINVTGVAGTHNGRTYVNIEGSKTAIPLDEVQFEQPSPPFAVENRMPQTSHAATAQAMGGDVEKGETMGHKEAIKQAQEHYDPGAVQKMANRLIRTRAPASNLEQAQLEMHGNALLDRKFGLAESIAAAKRAGGVPKEDDAKALAALEDHLDEVKKALNQSGSSLGSGLGFRAYKNPYSKINLVTELSAKMTGLPTTTDETALSKFASRIKELEDQLAKAATKTKESAESTVLPKQAPRRLVTVEDYAKAKEDLKKAWSKASVSIVPGAQLLDPEILAPLTKMAIYHLENGVIKAKEIAEKLMADIPGLNRQHAMDAANSAVSKYGKQVQEGRGFGEDVLTRGQAGIQDPEVVALRKSLAEEKAKADEYIKQRTPTDFYTKATHLTRAMVLQSLNVFPHLLGATAESVAGDVVGTVTNPLLLSKGVREALNKNLIPEYSTAGEFGKGVQRVFSKQMFQDLKDLVKQGATTEDIMHGAQLHTISREAAMKDPFGTLEHTFTNLHAATKGPLKGGAYERYVQGGLRAAKARGETITDALRSKIEAGAKERVKETLLLNSNVLAEAMGNGLKYVARQGGFVGQAGAALVRLKEPLLSLPTNVAGRMAEHQVGHFLAIGRAVYSKVAEGEITPEAWNDIVKLTSRGNIGTGSMAMGYYYKKTNPKAEIPNNVLWHGPLSLMFRMGMEIADATAKKKDAKEAAEAAFHVAAHDIGQHLPPTDIGMSIYYAMSDKTGAGWGKQIGETLSNATPGMLAWWARYQDVGNKRSPKGFTDELKMDVPYLRQQVPKKKLQYRGAGGRQTTL